MGHPKCWRKCETLCEANNCEVGFDMSNQWDNQPWEIHVADATSHFESKNGLLTWWFVTWRDRYATAPRQGVVPLANVSFWFERAPPLKCQFNGGWARPFWDKYKTLNSILRHVFWGEMFPVAQIPEGWITAPFVSNTLSWSRKPTRGMLSTTVLRMDYNMVLSLWL